MHIALKFKHYGNLHSLEMSLNVLIYYITEMGRVNPQIKRQKKVN